MDTSAMETSYAGVKGNLKLLCLEKSPKYGIMDRTIGGHDHKEGIIQKKDLQNFMPDSQTESFQTVVKKVKCPRCKKGKKLKCWRCVSARPKALAADHIFLSKEKTEICTQLEPLLKPLCTLSFETNATRRNIHDLEEEVSAKIQSNRKLAKAKERLKRTINEQSNVSKSVKDHLPVVIGQRAKNQKNTAMLDEEYCRVKKRQSKEIYRRMLVVMNKVFPMEKLDRAIVNRPPPEELEKQRLIREAGGKDIPIDYTVLLDVKRLQFTDMYRICCCTIPEVENLDFLKCELGKVNQSMHKEAVEQLAALNYIVQMVEKLSECIGYVLPYELTIHNIIIKDMWNTKDFDETFLKLKYVILLLCLKVGVPQEMLSFTQFLGNLSQLRKFLMDSTTKDDYIHLSLPLAGKLKETVYQAFKPYFEEDSNPGDTGDDFVII